MIAADLRVALDAWRDAQGSAATAAAADGSSRAAALLDELVTRRLDRLPAPGSGATLQRWQALAVVAAHDLSLAKLYEGHTDALAILAELDAPAAAAPNTTWGVWASEAPQGRTRFEGAGSEGRVTLYGNKCWCSGATSASHALVTAWGDDGRGPQLVRVALRQPGVAVHTGGWHGVGMAGSASVDVGFDGAVGHSVGGIGAYLARPGFWQGGAGIAACWYGGALGLAAVLRDSLAGTPDGARDRFRLAALGKTDLSLQACAALLRDAAAWIDAHPLADASEVALRVRLGAEACARAVLDEVGRALGATPFCRDAAFARRAADLPVFIRQSHAERDFVALGERLLMPAGATSWSL